MDYAHLMNHMDPFVVQSTVQLCLENATKLKNDGNNIAAVEELEPILSLNLPDPLRAMIHLERAKLYMLSKRYMDAKREAEASIHLDARLAALKLNADAILQMEGPAPALIMWCSLYIDNFEDMNSIFFLKEIVLLMVNYKDQLYQDSISLANCVKLSELHLENVLVELSRTNDWIAMGFLILGLFPNYSILCGAAKNCKTVNISIAPLLIQYKGIKKYWVDSLAAAIINGGSSIDHLWMICGQPPLHTVAEISVKSGFFQLYTVVAELSDINIKNKQGFTVTEYLQSMGLQSNPNYKKIIDINQQFKNLPGAIKKIEVISGKAKDAVQYCRYDEALQYYSQIMEILDDEDFAEKAKYYRNISLVYSYKKEYEKSLEFAEKCLSIDQKFGKAYWRKAQVLQALDRPHQACHTYLTGLANADDPLEFLSQAVKQIENNVDQLKKYDFKKCLPLFQKVEKALWSEFLCQAAKDSKWSRIKLLVLGTANDIALAKHFEASNLSLSTLYDSLKSDELLKKSCHMMLLKLLKNGAKIQTLSQNPDEAFHVLVKLVLLIESCDVLEYVLKRHPLTNKDSMLLHTAVKNGDSESYCCLKVIQLLLQKGLDPKATDSFGRKPSYYITDKFSVIGALLQIYTPDLSLESYKLKEMGNQFFKNKNYEVACSYYTIGIAMLRPQKDIILESILHGNRCECFLKMKELARAFTDASDSVTLRPDWYKACHRVGKVYRLENPARAYHYLHKAYCLLKSETENATKREIVKELCKIKLEIEHSSLSDIEIYDLLLASTELMSTNEFDVANHIFIYILAYADPPVKLNMYARYLDVRPFCSEAAILASGRIWGEVLMHFLQAGANLQNLSIYKGDTYLHAVSILASRKGFSYLNLLQFVLEKRTIRLQEINLIDSNGKTAFYRIVHEPNTEFKEHVFLCLQYYGSVLDPSGGAAITLPEDVYLTINDSTRKSPSEKTNKSSSSQKHPSKSPSSAKSRTDSVLVEEASKTVDPCSLHCEKLYNSSVKKQKSGSDANKIFQNLAELCRKNHEGKVHENWVSKSIDLIADQLDLSHKLAIPACLLTMKTNTFLELVLKLASTKKWICMYQAFESYQQKNKRNCLENFASTLTAADFLNSISFKEQVDLHGKILTCLIENGATIGKDPQLEKTALEVCLANREYRAIIILLKNGADPSLLTLSQGDTPLHAAAEIALRKDVGYFDLFEHLLELHDSDPVKYSYLDISCVDKSQQTLYHVACRIKFSKHSLRLVEILYKRGLSSDVPDAAGKIPYQYISQKPNDRRNGYLDRVSSKTIATESSSSNSSTSNSRNSTPMFDSDMAPRIRAEPKISIKMHLKNKIDILEDHECKKLHLLSFQKEDKKAKKSKTYQTKEETQNNGDLKESSGSEVDECEDADLLNSNAFENLEWEVECTSDVWKTLHNENMPYKKRKQAVFKIQQLASGDWRPASFKKVKDVPQTLKLYTIKLSRSSRIVWELAIAFSPRCSDVKLVPDTNNADLESSQGHVYSEVIRVWAVVFDLKDLNHVQDQIIKSHMRGENCLVEKQLESIGDGKDQLVDKAKRLPRLFAQKQIEKSQLDLQRFCPPASDSDHEYHIIKFYSFSTALVSSVLQMDTSRSIDFPFQVTELEHRIINLRSTAPIILLGRSGTGKTTCCLYRLWMNFVNYWSKAELADAPLYPLNCVEMRQTEADGEEQETEIGEDEHLDDTAEEKKEEQTKESCFEDETNPDSCPSDDVNADGQLFTHLHQLFVTKNGVLCSEVLKNFRELTHGCEVASQHIGVEDQPLPHTFQEITDNYFPLFLTSKKLWIVLDGSLDPPYFFPRQKDGSLKCQILGWSNEEDHLAFLPSLDEDDDTDDSFNLPYEFSMQQRNVADQTKEVSYEIFLQLWPVINKPRSGYHPSLVWTEIISFIKGSFEALNTTKGYLSEEQYIDIGRKRAPNFNGERKKVYEMFMRYQSQKRQRGMFDESDVVFNLYKRLLKSKQFPCPLHEIYVDETQDFTQAELCLLIQLSENPNQMFLTGDTAQSIMRGVAFRFSDLKSLFFYAQEQFASAARPKTIHCPKSLYELPHNYRSHQGILKLASSVIDMLSRYFSESFDPLKKDQGLFDGPKPKLLESYSFVDLAMLLRGNQRQTSQIEFGAHQVILVVNNESREKLPEELSTGLVLTIFEAKGLEFDDVLLYNFFQDSQASKEWRVVTEFLQELVDKQKPNEDSTNKDNLIKINMEVFQEANRPRPLAFNSNLHKILNSELKLLYTAVTRARVNLWIFDEDTNKRAPMFDYFKTLDLVQTVNTDNLQEEDMAELIFAENSTPEMWLQRGDELSHRSLYEIAAKCYRLGGHVQQEKIALANHQALTAQRCPDVQKKKEHFIRAADLYMDCNQHIKAAKCLANAKEKLLSAQLYEKCQEYEIAGMNYLQLQNPLRASQCFEIIEQFDRTVDILHDIKMYDHAIDAIKRYQFLVESSCMKGEILLKHKPQKDINYLCYRSADSHYKDGNWNEMKSVLNQLPSVEKMEFLEKKGLINLAADMLFGEGQVEQSIQLLRRNGKYEKCIELARSGTDEMLANCLYTFAQSKYVQLKPQVDENNDLSALQKETNILLEEAKACYQRIGDKNGYGLCLLYLGIINNDKDSVAEALTKFLLISPRPNVAGCLQSANILTELIKLEEIFDTSNIIKAIEHGYKLLKVLKSSTYAVSLPLREYLQHSGFQILNSQRVCIYPKLEPLVTNQLELTQTITSSSRVEYPITEIKQKLHRRLLIVIEKLFLWVQQRFMYNLSQSIQCPFYSAGYECQGAEDCSCPLQKVHLFCKRPTSGCLHRHEPYTEEVFKKAVTITTKLMVMDSELIAQVDKTDLDLMERLQNSLDKKNVYSISRLLLLLLTPVAGNGLPFKTLQQLRSMKKWFLSLQKCSVFVRNYLFATWKRIKFKNHHLRNFFLECPVLIGLFNLKVNTKIWMNQLSESAQCALPYREPKNSVLLFSKNMFFCIYERFVESLFYLHEQRDPMESLIKFTKYTTLLIRKEYPRLRILLFWCEFFVVLAFMLVLKNQKDFSVSLPESYIFHSFFIDCLQKNSAFSLQKTIQESKPLSPWKIKVLCDRIEKLVELLFGPNMMKIAIKERNVISGLTERYVVLSLVFLSHGGRGVNSQSIPKIIRDLSSIDIRDTMAPRLKEALWKIRHAKGSLNTILILTELLKKRGDNIGCYCWDYNPETQQGLQANFRSPASPVPKLNSVEFGSRSDECNFDDETEDESGFTEAELNQTKENYDRMRAVSTISRAYRAYKFCCSCINLAEKVSAYIARESGNEIDYFSDIKLSEAGCNICGVSFATESALPEEILLESVMTEEEHPSNIAEDIPKISEMKKHNEKSSHKANSILLRRCTNKYRREFAPVVKRAQELLSSYQQEDLNPEIAYDLYKLTKIVTKLDQAIIQTCAKASWNNLSSLESQLTELKNAFTEADKKITKKQSSSAAEIKVESHDVEDKELDDFIDTQEVVQEPRCSRAQISHKQKNKKH